MLAGFSGASIADSSAMVKTDRSKGRSFWLLVAVEWIPVLLRRRSEAGELLRFETLTRVLGMRGVRRSRGNLLEVAEGLEVLLEFGFVLFESEVPVLIKSTALSGLRSGPLDAPSVVLGAKSRMLVTPDVPIAIHILQVPIAIAPFSLPIVKAWALSSRPSAMAIPVSEASIVTISSLVGGAAETAETIASIVVNAGLLYWTSSRIGIKGKTDAKACFQLLTISILIVVASPRMTSLVELLPASIIASRSAGSTMTAIPTIPAAIAIGSSRSVLEVIASRIELEAMAILPVIVSCWVSFFNVSYTTVAFYFA